MYIPNWGEDIITGNAQIDAEHRELFQRLDVLMAAINQNRGAEVIQETLDFFSLYARTHFSDEERMHRDYQAPNYEAHVAAHRELAREVDALKAYYLMQGATPGTELRLINRVVRSMVEQLHEFDLPLAKFIQGVRSNREF